MKIWHQLPLVRLIIPFIAGILAAIYFPYQIENFYLIIIPYIAIIGIIVLVPSFRISYRKSWVFGLAINILLFALSYQLTIYKTEKFSSNHFSKYLTEGSVVHARLVQPLIEKDKSVKVIVEALEIKSFSKWLKVTGKAMVYINKDELSKTLKYGDEIFINSSFIEIPDTKNPGEFNYRNFLAFHNIYEQTYSKKGEWFKLPINSGNFLLTFCNNLRDALLKILRENKVTGDEYAVGAALLLGYSDMLEPDIISAYSSTGALHVLSVSGLHVAIVYIVFNWLLFFFDKFKNGKIIKSVLLIILLWLYSALTGLSPSVLRAAAMFSFIVIAKTFDWNTNIYNTLAASAFLLLAINPYLIMEVGFQLSYIAVIGIVYIQPKINSWFEPSNWLTKQIWTITSVSIAAQIATFPLGLHYFHQFPNYFLLSNFVVIPVSTVIIYLGIALFLFAKISFIGTYLAFGFSWFIWLLNSSVKMIEKWPYALLQGISITVFETWLIYGMTILFFYYFSFRKNKYLFRALGLMLVVLFFQIKEQYNEFHQKKMIVYNIREVTAIDFIESKNNILLTDSSFAHNESALLFHVKHNWWNLGINNSILTTGNYESNQLSINQNAISFNKKRIILLNDSLKIPLSDRAGKRIAIDYLVVSKNSKIKMEAVLNIFKPRQIIFDSSNSAYFLKRNEKICRNLNQNYYSVSESGAFVIDI
jgi:competence protein ComEC